MNLLESFKIMAVLKANYPFMDKGLSEMEIEGRANLWAEMFAGDEYAAVGAAVKAYIATDTTGFPPNIGAIKAKLQMLTEPKEMTEAEAWALVHKAIRNSGYNAAEEFKALPPACQKVVGSAAQLKEWAITEGLNMEVVSSNFMRSYKARVKNDKEYAALPPAVQAFMLEAAKVKELPNGESGLSRLAGLLEV